MSMDTVTLEAGATLGPHSVILPAATIGRHATVGPASLVMRGESCPSGPAGAATRSGPWVDDRSDTVSDEADPYVPGHGDPTYASTTTTSTLDYRLDATG